MANNDDFHVADIVLTEKFLEPFKESIRGGKVLDICGGIGRCGNMLAKLFDTIDIYDLKPSFGELEKAKCGRLIAANLKDINGQLEHDAYDCCFGSWSLSYIGFECIYDVLCSLSFSLKDHGVMILKEPILEGDDTVPDLCLSGQWMLCRPVMEIEKWLLRSFIIIKSQDIRQEAGYPRQRLWMLKKRPLVMPPPWKISAMARRVTKNKG